MPSVSQQRICFGSSYSMLQACQEVRKKEKQERNMSRVGQAERLVNNPELLETDGLRANKFSPGHIHSANSSSSKNKAVLASSGKKKKNSLWFINFQSCNGSRKFLINPLDYEEELLRQSLEKVNWSSSGIKWKVQMVANSPLRPSLCSHFIFSLS